MSRYLLTPTPLALQRCSLGASAASRHTMSNIVCYIQHRLLHAHVHVLHVRAAHHATPWLNLHVAVASITPCNNLSGNLWDLTRAQPASCDGDGGGGGHVDM